MIKKIQSLFLSFALIITSFVGLGQVASIAIADDFPSKPIEVVTHAGLGGGTDTTARMLLIRTRKNLKNNAYITPKKGDGGNKAMSYVKSKPRDGHTVLALHLHIYSEWQEVEQHLILTILWELQELLLIQL